MFDFALDYGRRILIFFELHIEEFSLKGIRSARSSVKGIRSSSDERKIHETLANHDDSARRCQ